MDELAGRKWVDALKARDEAVWDDLMCEISRKCFLDEDALQEAYVRLLEQVDAGKIDDAKMISGSPKAWVQRTARNLFIDKTRRNKKTSFAEDMEEGFLENLRAAVDSAEEAFVKREQSEEDEKRRDRERALIKQGIKKMKQEWREVIQLYYQQGWSVKRIADKLGISQTNVNMKKHRAHEELRTFMRDHGEDVTKSNKRGRPPGSGKKQSDKEAQP